VFAPEAYKASTLVSKLLENEYLAHVLSANPIIELIQTDLLVKLGVKELQVDFKCRNQAEN
jgi:hypothetical protein